VAFGRVGQLVLLAPAVKISDPRTLLMFGISKFQRRVDQLGRDLWNLCLSWRLARTEDYSFTEDYVTHQGSTWSQQLASLRGRSGARILEVGSFEGRSAIWFLENVLTHPTATITCVDPFYHPGLEARFDHNIRVSGHAAKVTKIKAPSEAVLPKLDPASYDAIYVDGSHLAVHVMMDAALSWTLVKPGGVLIFDDYLWQRELPAWARPQLAIDLFLSMVATDAVILHKAYQVIVRKLARPAGGFRATKIETATKTNE
jgi:predicted O-methyltransferase YrrM